MTRADIQNLRPGDTCLLSHGYYFTPAKVVECPTIVGLSTKLFRVEEAPIGSMRRDPQLVPEGRVFGDSLEGRKALLDHLHDVRENLADAIEKLGGEVEKLEDEVDEEEEACATA